MERYAVITEDGKIVETFVGDDGYWDALDCMDEMNQTTPDTRFHACALCDDDEIDDYID